MTDRKQAQAGECSKERSRKANDLVPLAGYQGEPRAPQATRPPHSLGVASQDIASVYCSSAMPVPSVNEAMSSSAKIMWADACKRSAGAKETSCDMS